MLAMTMRFELAVGSLALILVANCVVSLVVVSWHGPDPLEAMQERAGLDLSLAQAAYDGHVQAIAEFLQAASLERGLAEAVQRGDDHELLSRLQKIHRAGRIDFVAVLDERGTPIGRAQDPERRGGIPAGNLVVARALRDVKPSSGTILVAADDAGQVGGMVVAAAAPILDARGSLLGLLYGGDVLDGRGEIAGSIEARVFRDATWEGKQIGTVTIFQGDRSDASNGQHDGEYVVAWEPIRDPRGEVIGGLRVGRLREPFVHRRNVRTRALLAAVAATTLVGLGLLWVAVGSVLRPIRRIAVMSRKVSRGDLSARVGFRPSGATGVLCEAVDGMADAVAEREHRLELATRRQIGRSEKLASIGRLAAGVAHEINNPLTGVLTFAHLLRQKVNMDDQDRQDLDLIIRETTRAAEIVRGLLDFARERPALKEPLDCNEVIRRTLRLLGNQKVFQQIAIVEDLADDLPRVDGDMNQLQQVLLNLSLNACEAMPGGGTLSVRTSARDGRVWIEVTDTGCGIKEEHLESVFEPFFSTKPAGKGTGLGLSVSYGIVRQHGGSLEVDSVEGRGATFTLILPAPEGAEREEPRPSEKTTRA